MNLQELKTQLNNYRKQGQKEYIEILRVVVSESENKLKNPSSKGKNESQIIYSVIRSAIKNLEETMKVSEKNKDMNLLELELLQGMLPRPFTEDETLAFVAAVPQDLKFPEAMKWVKNHPLVERVDMSKVSRLLKLL